MGVSSNLSDGASPSASLRARLLRHVAERSAFRGALVESLFLTLVTEFGDKTFFLAAVLSMQNNRVKVFFGAMISQVLMTMLSTFIGNVLPALFSERFTTLMASIIFGVFGVQMLRAWWVERYTARADELRSAQKEVADDSKIRHTYGAGRRNVMASLIVRTFMMVLVAEWGDRSQMATIMLAASKNVIGIAVGGILAQAMCIGMAVLAGRFLARYVSENMMSFIGGVIFLVFSATSFNGYRYV